MCMVSDISVVARKQLELLLSITWALGIELRSSLTLGSNHLHLLSYSASPRKFLFLAFQNSNFMCLIKLT